ncbi:hypothetical protein GCM10011409_21800 [Lentibacillus populi]|uniref:Transcobalamin-like C-terminal domain-containing protein n=1 Tax=Lentibacillus populi TaxID=1827502 RepID=A0A9W5TY26_9BACI|nr:DUF4430 domain-containing protein [Lentibacillus populi]GGB43853.1 hypothetical protein GCM10011409_21800 [Lentibacillus populi]
MRGYAKYFAAIFFLLFAVFTLIGCEDSVKKPTGLEDDPGQEVSDSASDAKETDQKELKDKEKPKKSPSAKDEEKQETKPSNSDDKSSSDDSTLSNQKNTGEKSNHVVNKNSSSNTDEEADKNKTKTNKTNKKPDKEETKKSESSKNRSSKTSKPNENKEPETNKDTIVYSIVISGSEVPLPPTEIEITNEDTVLEALIQITKQKKIQMDYRGGQGATAYVEGIDNVYEFDRGQGSGWMYRINGVFPDRGAGVVPVCDGDRVEWLYTTNLGKDLGADLAPVRRDGKCPK